LARVGYRNIDDTGSALTMPIVIDRVRQLRYYWAVSGWRPKPPYRRLYQVGVTTVYGAHDVRIVWSVRGVGVWVDRHHRAARSPGLSQRHWPCSALGSARSACFVHVARARRGGVAPLVREDFLDARD
jgi:hypothetical protein